MADKQEVQEEEQENPPEQPEEIGDDLPKKGFGLFSLLKAGAFILVLVVVEVVAASMLIPSAQETEKLGRRYVAAAAGESALASENGESSENLEIQADVREVELGVYNITRYNPKTNSTLIMDFELYGTVLAEDEASFHGIFEKSKNRIREQVIMTLHSAVTSDLTDAGLGLIKRRILEKTNRALGQPLVQSVLFSKFNFLER